MGSRFSRRAFALAAVVLLALAAPGYAQTDTGRIEGIVTDSTGAVLPGVTVVVTNLATGVAETVISDEAGRYTVTGVRAGKYSIKVTLDGFTPVETPEVTIAVNQVARFDYTLEPGGVTEAVSVVAQSPVLERVTSSLATVIDEQQVKELPLNGRNFTQLATLTPGVTRGIPSGNASGASGNVETFRYGDSGGGALSVNGVREQFNNYMLDGVDNNESLVNSVSIFPPVEGVQEFRVITSGAAAEFGRAGGGVINVITKGGANKFSGSAYEFFRDDALDSLSNLAEERGVEKSDFRRNQFGASLGGPIVKNRAFFFGEYQGLREKLPVEVGGRVTVPTARMRKGDFGELLNPAFTTIGRPIVLYNPQTGQPLPGNVIPANLITSTGQRYLNAFPLPTFTDRAQYNYATNRVRDSDFNNVTGRVDYNLSDAANMFGRLSWGDEDRFDPGRIPNYHAGFGSGSATNDVFGLAVGYNRVLSPTWVTELRFGINNQEYAFLPVGYGNNQNAELGIGGPGGINNDNGIALIGGGNGRWIEYLGDFGQYIIPQRTYQLTGSVTWLRGAHTLKGGASLIRRRVSTERSQFGKGFYFFPFGEDVPTGPTAGRFGFEVAEMLAGTTDFTITGYPTYPLRDMINWENSLYVQDDWQISNRFTLNVGLRYDVFTPYYEADDEMANFDRTTQTLVVAGVGGVSRSTVDTDWNNVGPRVGFAYQLDDKSVLKGAYGLFYTLDRGGIDNQLIENPPFVASVFQGINIPLSAPIPLPPPPDPNNPVRRGFDRVVSVFPENKTNNVHQFNVSYQREVWDRTAAMVAYVGTRGQDLTTTYGGPNLDNVTFVDNIGSSDYDALQLQLRQSMSGGLSYLASYTLSKGDNDAPGPLAGGLNNAVLGTQPGLDPGAADYDRRHYFSLAATYELPWGREFEGVKRALLGGWQVNTILTFASGTPFSIFGTNGRRAAVSGDWEGPGTSDEWFNTSAFSNAPTLEAQSDRNLVYGPGISTVDLSFFKTFRMFDTHGLEVRVEFFNLFNKDQYENPDNNLGSSQFGQITQTRLNSQFQTQLAVRYTF
jgi:hypothetical protein